MLAELKNDYRYYFDDRFRSADADTTSIGLAGSTTEEVQRTLAEVESLVAEGSGAKRTGGVF